MKTSSTAATSSRQDQDIQVDYDKDQELAAALALSLEPQNTQGNQGQQIHEENNGQADQAIAQLPFWRNRYFIGSIATATIVVGIAAAIYWFRKK